MWAIAKRELRALFVAPFAWIVLGVAQTLLGYTFLRLLQAFAQNQGQLQGLPGAPGAGQGQANERKCNHGCRRPTHTASPALA